MLCPPSCPIYETDFCGRSFGWQTVAPARPEETVGMPGHGRHRGVQAARLVPRLRLGCTRSQGGDSPIRTRRESGSRKCRLERYAEPRLSRSRQSKKANFDATHELEELLLEDNPLKARKRNPNLDVSQLSADYRMMEQQYVVSRTVRSHRAPI